MSAEVGRLCNDPALEARSSRTFTGGTFLAAPVTTARSVNAVVPTIKTLEGGGFAVRRPFPTNQLDHVDPFLLLDHLGPTEYGANEAVGAPDHPHRGFETVTYILDGRLQHKDSQGNSGILGPGDV